MIYEVQARLLFVDQDEARDFYHDCELAVAKSTFIHENTLRFEGSIVKLIENHHDETPIGPCDVIELIINPPA